MKKELDQKLCKDFPLLYADRNGDPRNTCMCWGFPGTGWYELLYTLSEKIERIIKEMPEGEQPRAAQVKEKFGGLRFYMTHSIRSIDTLIDEAESLSTTICEICGNVGSVQNKNGWLKCMCLECFNSKLNQ